MVDTSAVVDFLLGVGVAARVERLMEADGELAAPDLLVFEVLAVLRRQVLRDQLADARAEGAVQDLGDLQIELLPSLPLRARVWQLRANFTAGDAIFLALAEQLDEPFATKDAALAAEAGKHTTVDVIRLRR